MNQISSCALSRKLTLRILLARQGEEPVRHAGSERLYLPLQLEESVSHLAVPFHSNDLILNPMIDYSQTIWGKSRKGVMARPRLNSV